MKSGGLEELNEVEHVSFGKVMWKSSGDQLVQKLGHAIEHRSERGREEADNRAAGVELLLSFWQDICIGYSSLPRPRDHGYCFLKRVVSLSMVV